MDKASMDKKLERIRNVIRACNKLKLKLKLKLYMEAMGCHIFDTDLRSEIRKGREK